MAYSCAQASIYPQATRRAAARHLLQVQQPIHATRKHTKGSPLQGSRHVWKQPWFTCSRSSSPNLSSGKVLVHSASTCAASVSIAGHTCTAAAAGRRAWSAVAAGARRKPPPAQPASRSPGTPAQRQQRWGGERGQLWLQEGPSAGLHLRCEHLSCWARLSNATRLHA